MTTLEKKIDALYRIVTAENDENKSLALKEARDIFRDNTPIDKTKLVKRRTEEILSSIGVRESLSGYDALVLSISMVVNNPALRYAITKELYPAVAHKLGSTSSRVDRCIRHAIETVFDRCDTEEISKFFGNSVSLHKGKPTNSEFIAKVAHKVRREIYDE